MSIEELYQLYKEYRSISTDSRHPAVGSIFFALKGEKFDGNKYAFDALEKGCSYAVVDNPGLPSDPRILLFTDVLQTLQKLANHHRNQLKIPFIGITGSNGKTTTKELIASVLGRKYKVCATPGNLNNHIGVPLTLLNVDDHDIAIIKMGANHIGEIALLCNIADPGFGIITNIGKAHLEGFGSPENVVAAKSELYDHLASRNATVFVDGTNPLLNKLVKERNLNKVIFGNTPESICSGTIDDSSGFLKIKIHLSGVAADLNVQSSMIGDYNLNNMLAAACIGSYFKVKPEDIASALSEYIPSNSRSQLLVTAKNKIVLDAYNANPSSMEGAVKNFLALKEELPKLIILGDMLELGKYSRSEHLALIELIHINNFKNLVLVGPEFCSVTGSSSAVCFKNVEELIEHFRSNPVKEHSILLKGSRGIKLEKLLEVL